MKRCRYSLMGGMTVMMLLAVTSHAALDESRWEQKFLFSLTDAYLQEPGQWQLSREAGYFQNLQIKEYAGALAYNSDTDNFWSARFDLAVGLTERLQANVSVPVGYAEINGNLAGSPIHLKKEISVIFPVV